MNDKVSNMGSSDNLVTGAQLVDNPFGFYRATLIR